MVTISANVIFSTFWYNFQVKNVASKINYWQIRRTQFLFLLPSVFAAFTLEHITASVTLKISCFAYLTIVFIFIFLTTMMIEFYKKF